jgi:hypothetical protein
MQPPSSHFFEIGVHRSGASIQTFVVSITEFFDQTRVIGPW